ncbi:MAG TPA: DUF4384 domain-containing protein [Vicinamibacterales bacterium]|nr:DUF4384 domain-containing protein [Vicinamibacterales bacterium]
MLTKQRTRVRAALGTLAVIACLALLKGETPLRLVQTTSDAPIAKWVEAQETVELGRELTYEQAERKALDGARSKAVREGAPTEILRQFLSLNRRAVEEVQREFSRGFITDERAITYSRRDEQLRGPTVTASGRFLIAQPAGDPDPRFEVRMRLNHTTFRPGDEVVFNVESTVAVALYVFNVTQDDRVTQLLPGPSANQIRVRGGQVFTFPSEEERRAGQRIVAALPPSGQAVSEGLWVLAFREGVPIDGWLAGAGVSPAFGAVPRETGALIDIWKALLRFNRHDWVMEQVSVEIRP